MPKRYAILITKSVYIIGYLSFKKFVVYYQRHKVNMLQKKGSQKIVTAFIIDSRSGKEMHLTLLVRNATIFR